MSTIDIRELFTTGYPARDAFLGITTKDIKRTEKSLLEGDAALEQSQNKFWDKAAIKMAELLEQTDMNTL